MALKESNLDCTDNTGGVVFTLREWVTWDWFKVYITVEFYLYFISLWKLMGLIHYKRPITKCQGKNVQK
jgi:hypothetical protein